jgi:predicted RNase H-like nuclease (RuvC/YqgF family)
MVTTTNNKELKEVNKKVERLEEKVRKLQLKLSELKEVNTVNESRFSDLGRQISQDVTKLYEGMRALAKRL